MARCAALIALSMKGVVFPRSVGAGARQVKELIASGKLRSGSTIEQFQNHEGEVVMVQERAVTADARRHVMADEINGAYNRLCDASGANIICLVSACMWPRRGGRPLGGLAETRSGASDAANAHVAHFAERDFLGTCCEHFDFAFGPISTRRRISRARVPRRLPLFLICPRYFSLCGNSPSFRLWSAEHS
jgi:hypothetical protein